MVPSLAISNLPAATPMMIVSLLLVDIARSFGVPVGVAGQIQTAFFAVTVIVARVQACRRRLGLPVFICCVPCSAESPFFATRTFPLSQIQL